MLSAVASGNSRDAVAAELGRSARAVLCRQQAAAARLVSDAGHSLAQAAQATGLTLEEVREGVDERQVAAAAGNKGKRWTDGEDATLLAAMRASTGIHAIASELGRSVGAVSGRLLTLAAKAMDGGASAEEAAAATGVAPELLRNFAITAKAGPAAAAAAAAAAAPAAAAAKPTDEQRAACNAVRAGRDVLITGPAGTGKSFTVALLIAQAHAAGKSVAVTATTGAAAALINGMTLHSFLGIGTGEKPLDSLLWHARHRATRAAARVVALDVLVVDEASMLSAELFDKVVAYVHALRGGKPFQLVLTGDFCQLPPVRGEFAFKAEAWAKRAPRVVQLTRLLRQLDDAPFQAMLMRLRWGDVTDADLDALRGLRDTPFAEGVEPTRLYPRNAEVDRVNGERFDALLAAGAETRAYVRLARGERAKAWADAAHVPERVDLAVGAQVMVTRNLPDLGLFNGSRGVVVALAPEAVRIKCAHGSATLGRVAIACESEPELSATAMPLRLAYALSIHKCQGVTLDAMEVDLGPSVFECGQGYVALSRARSLASVRVLDVDARAFRVHPEVAAFYGRN